MTFATITSDYHQLCCSQCGIVYFFPKKWTDQARQEGKSWQCPNGHGQWFGESSYDKLKRERDRLAQRIAEKDDEAQRLRAARQETERRLSATKGVVTRIKNRVGNGVCPCCNRSFSDLHRHMTTKHPSYIEAAE